MLRTKTKEKLNAILDLQLQIHKHGIAEPEQVLPEVLSDCQQAAISIGQRLEKELPDRTDLVKILEQYCEELYQFSQGDLGSDAAKKAKMVVHLDELIVEVRDQLSQLPLVYQAVFMPYKAEMWDSLESVWMAFDQDENCEALVMPLPYSQFDAGSQTWSPYYEGARFPEYVPITDYHDYHLEEEYPEFIFIHNPYDEYNRVTRIDPAYFSYELKKYTKTLVYIPYYLTSGFVQEEHKLLSAYRYMDYMIAQSELFKDGMKETPFYDKVLPLGSPKLDRVIRLCQGEKQIPEEWRKVIGDKKSVMLNTSLGYFLHFGERYLNKVRAVIDWIKENPIIALIWRPHPLFESTIRSIRPELLPMYQELVQYFLDSGIGVFDQTPDIAHTIAIVDAYIGDSWTSVINLFGAAGRPMFILDASRTRASTEEEKRRVSLFSIAGGISGIKKIDGKWWITSRFYNGVFCVEEDWNQVQFVHRFQDQPHWNAAYGSMLIQGRFLYMSPGGATKTIRYNIDTGVETEVGWKENGKVLGWGLAATYKGHLFYFSANLETLGFYVYREKDKSWTVHQDALKELVSARLPESQEPCISGSCYDWKHCLWYTGIYTNRVLCFDMETCTHRFYQIGSKGYGYTGICVIGDVLYLGEAHGTGLLLEVNLKKNTLCEYPLPKEGRVWKNLHGVECAVGGILDMGKYLLLCPGHSNRMWRFERETGEFVSMAEEFWDETAEKTDNYFPEGHGVCNFLGIPEESPTVLWAQRGKDDAILILDVETGKYEVRYMHLSEEAFTKLLNGEDGFQKYDITAPFVQSESNFFCYDDFICKVAGDEYNEVKQRQKKELVTLAANMDGTCGEQIYQYLRAKD